MEKINKIIINNCCGCGACSYVCAHGAIDMKENVRGFLEPQIDDTRCIECGACVKFCGFKNSLVWLHSNSTCKDTYAVKKKHGRLKSQSGGAFSAFAETVISNDGVVYGVELQGSSATYIRVLCIKDIDKIKKSKYVQASLGDTYKNIEKDLINHKNVLFCGPACYVDGLKTYLQYNKIDTSNLYTVDFTCAGVSSPGVFNKYIYWLQNKFGSIKNYIFRYKTIFGWRVCTVEKFAVGRKEHVSGNWMKIALSGYAHRPSCFACPYVNVERISDITIADFWGIEKVDSKLDDGNGLSYVLVNNEKGKQLFNKSCDRINYYNMDTEQCVRAHMKNKPSKPEKYEDFWKMYFDNGFENAVREFCDFNMNDYNKKYRLIGHNIKQQIKYVMKYKTYKRS